MATPPDISIDCLNGKWILNKELSSDTIPILRLQNVHWLLRKAFAVATIYLQISEYSTIAPGNDQPLTKIDFLQTATGGLAGTKENRVLNWELYDHKDYFFGSVEHQSRFIHGFTDTDGSIRPEFELRTPRGGPAIKSFLRGEIDENACKSPGFLVEKRSEDIGKETIGLWVHTFERNRSCGWTAEQVWGFEMIGDLRYFSRRVVVASSEGTYICGKLVYDFQGA